MYTKYVLYLLLLCYIVLVIKLIYNIILKYDNCNPVKTVGWILGIVFFPVLGILVYITAGRNLRKKEFSLRTTTEADRYKE